MPTGNFGDIFAGFIAKKMGLSIDRLVVATNQNDILHRCLTSGVYKTDKVLPSISPSMDIQVSSNFERALFYAADCDGKKVSALMDELKILASSRFLKAYWRSYKSVLSVEEFLKRKLFLRSLIVIKNILKYCVLTRQLGYS